MHPMIDFNFMIMGEIYSTQKNLHKKSSWFYRKFNVLTYNLSPKKIAYLARSPVHPLKK